MRLRPGEWIVASLTVAAFGGAAVSWAAIQLASLASGLGTADVSGLDVMQVLPNVMREPGDPLATLRASAAEELPDAAVVYGALFVTLAALGLAGGLAVALMRRGATGVRTMIGSLAAGRRRDRGKSGPLRRGATWARRGDVRDLVVAAPQAARLTFGYAGGRLLAGEAMHSLLVIGPTGSLKTTALATPNILEWDGPVVAASVKNDLLADTFARREQLGRIQVFDPARVGGFPGAQWTPLGGCEDWDRAQQRAKALCSVGSPGKGEMDFWFRAAAKLLGTLMYAVARSGGDVSDLVRWVNTQEIDEVDEALEDAPDLAASAWAAEKNRDAKQRSSIYTTAEAALEAYNSQAVLDYAQRYDIRAEQLLDGGAHTLYLVAPAKQQKRMQPLFVGILEEVLDVAYERSQAAGGRLPRPLLVVLDEAANIAPLEELDVIASTARGHDVQVVTIFHDVAQIKARYGEKATSIVNNHRAKLFLPGIADPETLRLIASITGEEEMLQVTRNYGRKASDDHSEATAWRSIAPADVVREQRPGDGMLVYGHLKPAKVRLRPWFRDRRLSALVAGRGE